MPPGDGYHFAKYLDMNMMVLTDGGHERTSDEYAHLLGLASLRLTRIISATGPWSIVEARPS